MNLIRNGVVVAIIAHGLIGASLLWDKVLLRQPATRNLLSYVFWLGMLSVFGLALFPFGFRSPPPGAAALALGAGVLHLVAIFFYYAALKRGEASQALAVMGGFSPVATVLLGLPLLSQPLPTHGALLAFVLLVAGGFVMFFSEHLALGRVLPPILLASVFTGLMNVLQKRAFDATDFVTGYVLFTLGTFAGALLMLVPPSWRRQILTSSQKAHPRSRFWYFVNRFASGLGSFFIFYAISLTHPAVVEAISGVRYAVIFLGAWLLSRFRPRWLLERFSGSTLLVKAVATLLIISGLVVLGLQGRGGAAPPPQKQGLSPSPGARPG